MRLLVLATALLSPDPDNEIFDWEKHFTGQQPAIKAPADQALKTFGSSSSSLSLEQILSSVKSHYPPLLAALSERDVANGDLVTAEGRFDTTLRARGDLARFGYYENERFDVSVEQPLQWNGLSLYSGYRYGDGDYPVYDLNYLTRSDGEWRSGLKAPLFRGRSTDSRRTELAKARVGKRLADLSIDSQKIAIVQAATRAYWNWVAAGRRYEVARRLLQIARDRERFLEESVHLGQMAPVEIVDNRRVVSQREAQLAEAERFLQQAAIELSLYNRDSGGNPLVPGVAELPTRLPEPELYDRARLDGDIQLAVTRRPEIARLTGQSEQAQQDLKLALNDALPQIDLFAGVTTERGTGIIRRGPQDFKAGISFELPLQRRVAKGRQEAAKARLEQIRQRSTYARDQVKAEVRDAASALNQSYERYAATQIEVDKTRQVEDAERTRYELGDGTLFVLNLRELQTAESELRLINAQADYQRAKAQYEYALASALTNW